MSRKDKMATIACPKCNKEAQEVIHAEKKLRKGWWCPSCNHFEEAILRERKVA